MARLTGRPGQRPTSLVANSPIFMMESRSGLSVRALMGSQFRVSPDQRAELSSRALSAPHAGQPESHERSLRGAGPGYHNESRCAGDLSCTGRRSLRPTCGLAAIVQQLGLINDRLIIGC